MPLYGQIGGEVADELTRILARQFAEQLQRQQMKLQSDRMTEDTRQFNEQMAETKRRHGVEEQRLVRGDRIAEAEGLTEALDAGFDPSSPLDVEVPEGAAAQLAGTPSGARVREIPTLGATPTVPGMSEMGPPSVGVRRLSPTAPQQGARRVMNVQRITGEELAGAQNAGERRAVAARAYGAGGPVPPESLIGPTEEERLETILASEERENKEWDRRHAQSRQPQGAFQWVEDAQGNEDYRIPQTGDRRIPPPPTGTAEAQLVDRLQRRWLTVSAQAREIDRQVGVMRQGMGAAARGDMGPASEAVLQTFLKIIDPNSVVREGEFQRLYGGTAVLDRAEAAFQRIRQGGWATPETLQQYARLAEEIQSSVRDYTERTQKPQIQATARRYGIPDELIFGDPTASGPPPPPPQTPALTHDANGRRIRP